MVDQRLRDRKTLREGKGKFGGVYSVQDYEGRSQLPTHSSHFSSGQKSHYTILLLKDSENRLSLKKIMEHSWILKNADPMGSC